MTLSPEQKQAVSSWIAAGDGLSAVQKKLSEQFKISMTYMDVRFLVDDLGLELKNAAPKADAADVGKAPAKAGRPAAPGNTGLVDPSKTDPGQGEADEDLPADETGEPAYEDIPASPAGAGGLTLEIDRVVRPGAAVSGNVTFTDGVSGKWALDQYGRLMLDTGNPAYKPSAADVQAFQRELQAQMQRHGF